MPDEWLIEDVAAAGYLRSLPTSNGRVGVIGYGAGGQQAVLAACNIDFDATVDCYGGFVVGARPEGVFPFRVTNIVHQLPRLRAPLLGLSGEGGQLSQPPRRSPSSTRSSPRRTRRTSSIVTTTLPTHSSRSTTRDMTLLPPGDGWERITAFYDAHPKG